MSAPAANGGGGFGGWVTNNFLDASHPIKSMVRVVLAVFALVVVFLVGSCAVSTVSGISTTTMTDMGCPSPYVEAYNTRGVFVGCTADGGRNLHAPTTQTLNVGAGGNAAADLLNNGAGALLQLTNAALDSTVNNPALWGAAGNLLGALAPLIVIAIFVLMFRGGKGKGGGGGGSHH